MHQELVGPHHWSLESAYCNKWPVFWPFMWKYFPAFHSCTLLPYSNCAWHHQSPIPWKKYNIQKLGGIGRTGVI